MRGGFNMSEYDINVHLGLIQGVIDRMAKNSLSCKTWALTLFSALIAVLFNVEKISANNYIAKIFWIAILVMLIIFWQLDSWYLRLERLFRRLYEAVCKDGGSEIKSYSLSIESFDKEEESVPRIMISYSECTVYLPLVILCVVFFLLNF